jgi:hypothetical protein
MKSEEAEIEAEVEVKNFGFQISDLPSVSSASLRFGFWIEAEVEVKELYCIRAFVAIKNWCFGALVAKSSIRAFVAKRNLFVHSWQEEKHSFVHSWQKDIYSCISGKKKSIHSCIRAKEPSLFRKYPV